MHSLNSNLYEICNIWALPPSFERGIENHPGRVLELKEKEKEKERERQRER